MTNTTTSSDASPRAPREPATVTAERMPERSARAMHDILAGLTRLPHRGSATIHEAEARDQVARLLEAGGHAVTRQPFTSPLTYGWELLVISLVIAVGGLAASPWLALLGLAGLWTYFSGWTIPWRRLVDRHPSENLLARVGTGPKTLVLMAHLDSAKSFFVYHPKQVKGFRRSFLITITLAVLTVPTALLFPLGARVLGVYFLVYALLLVHREVTARHVNGANDNASGVAVGTQLFLDLGERLAPDWNVMLAITGCEEVGAKGATALARAGLIPRDALVLNLDNVGRGDLHYAKGEGMLGYYPFRGRLLDAARALPGAESLAYRLAYFDTLPFVRAGYECLTLIRLEDGLPPHWHWPSDTSEHVDPAALDDTYRYVWELVTYVGAVSEVVDVEAA